MGRHKEGGPQREQCQRRARETGYKGRVPESHRSSGLLCASQAQEVGCSLSRHLKATSSRPHGERVSQLISANSKSLQRLFLPREKTIASRSLLL